MSAAAAPAVTSEDGGGHVLLGVLISETKEGEGGDDGGEPPRTLEVKVSDSAVSVFHLLVGASMQVGRRSKGVSAAQDGSKTRARDFAIGIMVVFGALLCVPAVGGDCKVRKTPFFEPFWQPGEARSHSDDKNR